MPLDYLDIEPMIEDCLNRTHKMTEWEQSFIQSIGEQFEDTQNISHKQENILNRIWEKVT